MTEMMERIPVTVGILTYTSSIATVEATLRSALAFDDVLLCDGHSTDGTRELAASLGCRVIDQAPEHLDENNRLINEAGVNEQILASAKHPWVFFLDHDELATPELVEEIRTIVGQPRQHGAYEIPRLYVVDGEVITCAAMYPRYQTRLIHRDAAVGYSGLVHSPVVLKDGETKGTLEQVMLIPLMTQRELWSKWHGYLRLEELNHLHLSRAQWVSEVVKPQWKMCKWIVYRVLKVRRTCEGPRLSLDYELGRVIYELAMIWYTGRRFIGLGNRDAKKAWR